MISPPHAARTWIADSHIWMEFNSSKTSRTHCVSFPSTPDGFALIVDVLKARTPRSTVATRGAPIQYDVEKLAKDFLKRGGKIQKRTGDKFAPEQRANARDVMRELGLI